MAQNDTVLRDMQRLFAGVTFDRHVPTPEEQVAVLAAIDEILNSPEFRKELHPAEKGEWSKLVSLGPIPVLQLNTYSDAKCLNIHKSHVLWIDLAQGGDIERTWKTSLIHRDPFVHPAIFRLSEVVQADEEVLRDPTRSVWVGETLLATKTSSPNAPQCVVGVSINVRALDVAARDDDFENLRHLPRLGAKAKTIQLKWTFPRPESLVRPTKELARKLIEVYKLPPMFLLFFMPSIVNKDRFRRFIYDNLNRLEDVNWGSVFGDDVLMQEKSSTYTLVYFLFARELDIDITDFRTDFARNEIMLPVDPSHPKPNAHIAYSRVRYQNKSGVYEYDTIDYARPANIDERILCDYRLENFINDSLRFLVDRMQVTYIGLRQMRVLSDVLRPSTTPLTSAGVAFLRFVQKDGDHAIGARIFGYLNVTASALRRQQDEAELDVINDLLSEM